MGASMIGRRDVLRLFLGASALAPLALGARPAAARDRLPYGGNLRLQLPLNLATLDPHDLFSLPAAVLESALFDSLYARDDAGRPYPTLAEALPEATQDGLRVELRRGLTTATGRALAAADLEFALRRAASSGAKLLLAPFGAPRARGSALLFPRGEAQALARALSSPLAAVVPRGFRPQTPDGTGPFAFGTGPGKLVWQRNARAARGGGFLDRIEIRGSSDLATALRAFEANEVDVGWLASGLHRARQEAVPLDAGALGWIVLATGSNLGPWGAPGVAQSVLEASDLSPLGALGVVPRSPAPARPSPWRGPPAQVLVDGDQPQLLAIARALVEALGGAASRLEVAPLPAATLASRRAAGDYTLLVDFVRTLGPAPEEAGLALLTAASLGVGGGAAATTPSRAVELASSGESLDSVVRRLRVGVVGELRLRGAHLGTFARLSRWQLGDVHRAPTRKADKAPTRP